MASPRTWNFYFPTFSSHGGYGSNFPGNARGVLGMCGCYRYLGPGHGLLDLSAFVKLARGL